MLSGIVVIVITLLRVYLCYFGKWQKIRCCCCCCLLVFRVGFSCWFVFVAFRISVCRVVRGKSTTFCTYDHYRQHKKKQTKTIDDKINKQKTKPQKETPAPYHHGSHYEINK